MQIKCFTLFSTLALSACVSRAAAENEAIVPIAQGGATNVTADIRNGSAIADGGNAADQNENEDGNNNLDQLLNGNLGNSFDDINIDPNDIQGSLGQNILDLLLSMGICNFNLNSLQGLSLGNEIQLLLQLQQLQQLQSLGVVNSFTVDQLIQREILSRTFNLNIIKRSIDASVKQAARGKKRTVMLRRQCANVGQLQGDANNGAGQDEADQDQVNQDQANQDEKNQDEENQDEADDDEEKDDAEEDVAEEEKKKKKKNVKLWLSRCSRLMLSTL
ncbi:hypothetical protein E0Z10_g8574 [Xylaria hypoxylon]|uniref:Uncharacterized protein n=1 Tax=Xylaria hypoxylon TaxID=37992 RepID=A0A4Z0YAX6_9PEZI|nr:hypothetical protein E0Z10_g8574 [Xylaria hypoxylon]